MLDNKINIKSLFFITFFAIKIILIISDMDIKLKYDDYGRPYSSVYLGTKSLCLSLTLDTDYIDILVLSSTSKKDIKNKYESSISKKSSIV